MSIESTLAYIENVKWQGSKPGLTRTRELLAALGNPERQLKFAHIAGTNGKGSTAAMMESVLRKAGYRTGLYTSPYIRCFNERMQVDGQYITDAELEEITDKIRPFADAMTDAPTEFELITAIAMEYFLQKKCDIVVLEVGLGGELDSTNVIPAPEVAVITAIGLDHMKELGDTIEEIAGAKAGIIKRGGSVVVYGEPESAVAVFRERCVSLSAQLRVTDFSRVKIKERSLDHLLIETAPYRDIRLPLTGVYQSKNAELAVTALEVLRDKGYRISDENIVAGLESVYWPGRFEVLRRDPVFILDGAHNIHGMEATAGSLRAYFPDSKIVFVLGAMADKDLNGMLSFLLPLAKQFFTVTPKNERAMPATELARFVSGRGAEAVACSSIPEGVAAAVRAAGNDGVVCALGSLYFSGDVREAVKNTN